MAISSWPRMSVLLALSCVANAASRNILFLIVDEMDGRILDDASPQFKPPMPNIRKLMAQGTSFPSSYTSAPQCVPARTSMMTGRHTSDIKVWDNFVGIVSVNGQDTFDSHCIKTFKKEECSNFAKNQTTNGTFIDVLADAGYNVTLWGKMHAGAGLDRYQGKLSAFPFSKGGAKGAKEFSRASGVLPRKFNIWNENPNDHMAKPATAMDYVATEACSGLLRGGLFQSTTPQFLYCSILVPHPPYASNSTYMKQVPSLGNWSIPHWTSKGKLHPSDAYTQMIKGGGWNIESADPALVDHFRRVYFSMCVEADEMMGQILDSLKVGGSREEPFIVFLADHGEHNLEHRQTGKNSMLEASSRVPFVIAGPGIPKGSTNAQLASLHDVYPTIVDMAGTQARGGPLAGESLVPVAKGAARNKQYVISQYHSVFSGTGMYMVRMLDWKLVLYGAQQQGGSPWEPQLFNIATDPWELQNLASVKPKTVETLSSMLAKEVDLKSSDAEKKAFDVYMFNKYWYEANGGASKCAKAMSQVYHGFDSELDAPKIEAWLGRPCPAIALVKGVFV